MYSLLLVCREQIIKWCNKPWSCTRWLSEWSWPVGAWGCSCGVLRSSGNFLMTPTRRTAVLRRVGVWWAQTGTGVVGTVTGWRLRRWHGANPWAAVTSQAWLTVRCRHTLTPRRWCVHTYQRDRQSSVGKSTAAQALKRMCSSTGH